MAEEAVIVFKADLSPVRQQVSDYLAEVQRNPIGIPVGAGGSVVRPGVQSMAGSSASIAGAVSSTTAAANMAGNIGSPFNRSLSSGAAYTVAGLTGGSAGSAAATAQIQAAAQQVTQALQGAAAMIAGATPNPGQAGGGGTAQMSSPGTAVGMDAGSSPAASRAPGVRAGGPLSSNYAGYYAMRRFLGPAASVYVARAGYQYIGRNYEAQAQSETADNLTSQIDAATARQQAAFSGFPGSIVGVPANALAYFGLENKYSPDSFSRQQGVAKGILSSSDILRQANTQAGIANIEQAGGVGEFGGRASSVSTAYYAGSRKLDREQQDVSGIQNQQMRQLRQDALNTERKTLQQRAAYDRANLVRDFGNTIQGLSDVSAVSEGRMSQYDAQRNELGRQYANPTLAPMDRAVVAAQIGALDSGQANANRISRISASTEYAAGQMVRAAGSGQYGQRAAAIRGAYRSSVDRLNEEERHAVGNEGLISDINLRRFNLAAGADFQLRQNSQDAADNTAGALDSAQVSRGRMTRTQAGRASLARQRSRARSQMDIDLANASSDAFEASEGFRVQESEYLLKGEATSAEARYNRQPNVARINDVYTQGVDAARRARRDISPAAADAITRTTEFQLKTIQRDLTIGGYATQEQSYESVYLGQKGLGYNAANGLGGRANEIEGDDTAKALELITQLLAAIKAAVAD